jgi:ABC-type lipoprotein release transport system permease subunit
MMASLGMSEADLKRIFSSLGFIIVAIGVLAGALLGCVIVGLHEWLALIKIPGSLKAFPSALLPTQVLSSVLSLVFLGISATWATTSFLMKARRIGK